MFIKNEKPGNKYESSEDILVMKRFRKQPFNEKS
jgi:hypothetical protein